MSTMRCCSAWNVPIGTPNCLRVFRYSSVVSLANFIAPTASAQSSAVAKSTASSISGERVALGAEQRVARDAHVVEHDVGGAQLVERAVRLERHAGASRSTRNRLMPRASRRARVRAETTSVSARGACSTDALLAVERPAVAAPLRACADMRAGRSARPSRCARRRASACPATSAGRMRLLLRVAAGARDRAARRADGRRGRARPPAPRRTLPSRPSGRPRRRRSRRAPAANGRPRRPISANVRPDVARSSPRARRRSSCAPRSRSPWPGSAGRESARSCCSSL